MKLPLVTAVFLVALRLTTLCAATGEHIDVGGVDAIIPAPQHFLEARDSFAEFPPEMPNRLLAVFMTPDEVKQRNADPASPLTKFMQIQVSKDAENHDLTSSEFSDLATKMSSVQDNVFGSAVDDVNAMLKKMLSQSPDHLAVELSQPKTLGTFLNTDNAVGILMAMSMKAQGPSGIQRTQYVIASCVLFRVKNRLLYSYTYCDIGEKDAVGWVKSAATDWMNAILAANEAP